MSLWTRGIWCKFNRRINLFIPELARIDFVFWSTQIQRKKRFEVQTHRQGAKISDKSLKNSVVRKFALSSLSICSSMSLWIHQIRFEWVTSWLWQSYIAQILLEIETPVVGCTRSNYTSLTFLATFGQFSNPNSNWHEDSLAYKLEELSVVWVLNIPSDIKSVDQQPVRFTLE